MDFDSIQQQLIVPLEYLDQAQAEVRQIKENLKDLKNFIHSLNDQLNKSREKRKELVDKLNEKEIQSIHDQVLKEKT